MSPAPRDTDEHRDGYIRHLVELLAVPDYLSDPLWHIAFAEVPPHLFTADATGSTDTIDSGDATNSADRETAVFGDPGLGSPGSASTPLAGSELSLPTLAWALACLSVDGDGSGPLRVLQLGGGGYLTALLCHRLGDRHVVTVEPDSARAARTGRTLRGLGWYPEIVTEALSAGAPEHGPFDRVLALGVGPAPALLPQIAPGGHLTRLHHPIPTSVPGAAAIASATRLCRVANGVVIARAHPAPPIDLGADADAVEFLMDRPGLMTDLHERHSPDEDGRCRGCLVDRDVTRRAPCPVRVLVDTAHAAADAAAARAAAGTRSATAEEAP